MGHEIRHYVYDENESKERMYAIANEDCEYGSDNRTGLDSGIRFLENHIYEDEDAAYKAIEDLDKGWYDQLAVKFQSYSPVKDTKAIINLSDRIDKARESIVEYKSKNSIKNRKSQYVGCSGCGSKINKEYVQDAWHMWNKCPLCKEDLSSDTIKNSIISKEEKIVEMTADLESKRKLNAKKGKKSISWLVKTEYHI